MKLHFLVLSMSLLSGTITSVAASPILSPGIYTLDMKTIEAGEEQEKPNVSEYTLSINGTNIVLSPITITESELVGSIQDRHLLLAIRFKDPTLDAMGVHIALEGEINRDNSASGEVKGFYQTNNYINGTWILNRKEDK